MVNPQSGALPNVPLSIVTTGVTRPNLEVCMTRGIRCLGMAVGMALSLSAGCGPGPIEPPPPPPTPLVAVAPSTLRLGLSESVQLHVTVAAALAGDPVAWSSSNPAVAAVTPAGMVRATGIGFAEIKATVRSEVGKAVVTVGQAPCPIILRCPGT